MGNYVKTNPRKSLGVLAALAIAAPLAMNKSAETKDRNMYGYPVSYTEGKGLSDDNAMEVTDNSVKGEEIVYRYVDSDGPILDLSSKREPIFYPRTLEEITVIYNGRTERFVREDADAPELFAAHNRVFNGALKNLVAEHYEPEQTRRDYLIKRAGNLADVFDPQPAYKPQPKGPPAD